MACAGDAAFNVNYDAQVRPADLCTRLYELPIPVIAGVNGVAAGGGLAFALHCDIRIASESARFGSVCIKAGFSSMDMGTSYLLPKIVGAGVAREIVANNAFGAANGFGDQPNTSNGRVVPVNGRVRFSVSRALPS